MTNHTGGGFEKTISGTTVVNTIITDEAVPVTPDGDTAIVSLVGPGTVIEGEVTTDYTVTITEAPLTDLVVTFNYTTTDADGDDYTAVGSATILANQTSATFNITTLDDTVYEGNEDYSVSIASVANGGLEDVRISPTENSVTTTITDEADVPSLSIDNQTVNEDAGTMTFTVTLSNPSTLEVTVDYISDGTEGTATENVDYDAVNGSLTFAPGVLTQTITVPITDDYIAEGSETFDMILSNATNATIADTTGLGQILDEPTPGNEDTVNVTLAGDTAVTEGATASYVVTLSQAAITPMTITVTTGHITTEDGDLVPVTQQVTFAIGATQATLTVSNTDDAYAEGDETYAVALSGAYAGGGFEAVNVDTTPVNTVISDNTTPGTEVDDEITNITLTGDATVAEGASATYTITLGNATASPMQVEVQTGHTTTEDGDLIPTTMFVDVPANATSVTFTVANNSDTTAEGNEDYTVALTGTTTGGGFETVNVNTGAVTTTIVDDDVLSISIDDVTVNEDAGTMTFTVALSTDTTSDVTFDFASADNGSALAGLDYTAVNGSGTITAGQTTTTITVPITDDYLAENPETFVMNLTNISAGVVVADAQGLGTIIDEPTPGVEDTVTVSIAGSSDVNEGNNATYTVSTDKAVQTDMTVDVTYSYTSAESGDVVTNTVQVTIPAGTSTAPTFDVGTVDDAYLEGNEVFNVTISNPQGGGVENVVLGTSTIATTIHDGTDEDDGGTGVLDTATVSITGDSTVTEGESASYTVSVDKLPVLDMTVDVTYSYTSAESGDINTSTISVTIPAGSLSVPFDVATIDDSYAEGDEVFAVTISNPSSGGFENVVLGTDTASTTILDNTTPGTETDDEVINVVLSGTTTVTEGGNATYTVTVDEATITPMDIEVVTGHTTTEDGDLIPTTVTVTIPAGATSVDFIVSNNQDTTFEGNEDYTVTLNGTTSGGASLFSFLKKTTNVTLRHLLM